MSDNKKPEPKVRCGSQEEVALRIVHRERGEASGRTVLEALQEIEGRTFALTTIFTILERLEQKGLVESRMTEPVAERGGRRKQLFTITGSGVLALTEAQLATERRQNVLPIFTPEKGGAR